MTGQMQTEVISQYFFAELVWLAILLALCASTTASEVSLDDFSNGVSRFLSDFYQEVVSPDSGNVIVSPYSVASALAFLSQGADGNSFEQIKSGLHLNIGKSEIADNYNYLQYHGLLRKDAGNVSFAIVNHLFVQEGFALNKTFKEVATNKFFSGVENVNFAKKAEAASTINHFVAEKTNNKITELISADALDSSSRLILVNAIHIRGKWERPFELQEKDFYVNEVDKSSVDFLHQIGVFDFASLDDLNASALELRYADSELSLLIILPNKRTGLLELETKLKSYSFGDVIEKLCKEPVDVAIPKFKIEYQVELNDVLKRMGMADIFDIDKADLSGLLESNEDLYVAQAIHKAFIAVNEKGTEAAAATGLHPVPRMGYGLAYGEPLSFRADHPFVYHVWDRKLKTPIFSGRVVKLGNTTKYRSATIYQDEL